MVVVVVQASPYQVENFKQESKFSLLMPNAKPTQPETYLCTTIRLDRNTTNYITGFTPQGIVRNADRIPAGDVPRRDQFHLERVLFAVGYWRAADQRLER